MGDHRGKYEVIDPLGDTRGDQGSLGKSGEVSFIGTSDQVVEAGIYKCGKKHRRCRTDYDIPGTAKCTVDPGRNELACYGIRCRIVGCPGTRCHRQKLKDQHADHIDTHREDRDLRRGFRTETLADTVHTKKRDPGKRQTAVETEILRAVELLTRHKVHENNR